MLLAAVESKYISKYSIDTILEPFIEDMKDLESVSI